MFTSQAPAAAQPTRPKVGLGRSVLWTCAIVAGLPALLTAAWVAGRAARFLADRVAGLHLAWPTIALGGATLAGAAVLVSVVHLVRIHVAKTKWYRFVDRAAACLPAGRMAPVTQHEHVATAAREGRWWVVSVDGVGVTQSRSLREAPRAARGLVAAMLDVDEQSVQVAVKADLDPGIAAQVTSARQQDSTAPMPAAVVQYLNEETALPFVKAQLQAHDPACASLVHAWLGRHGGVSSWAELGSCTRCGVTFFWDGLREVLDPDSGYIVALCDCCRRGATTTPAATPTP